MGTWTLLGKGSGLYPWVWGGFGGSLLEGRLKGDSKVSFGLCSGTLLTYKLVILLIVKDRLKYLHKRALQGQSISYRSTWTLWVRKKHPREVYETKSGYFSSFRLVYEAHEACLAGTL